MDINPGIQELANKLKAARPAVEAAQKSVVERVNEHIARQRALEGIRAAMRDPVTGIIYTGRTHQSAIESVPKSDETGAWGRLSSEWDAATENSGFIDAAGNFVSRAEAEKNWGVLTMEDVRDALKPQNSRGHFAYR